MTAPSSSTVLLDHPDNLCFGCSPHNPHGMRMSFTRREDRSVEAWYTTEPHFAGAPGVVHGGVQAVLLDEIIGVAIHEALDDSEDLHIVTLDFALQYRRPVPAGETILLRGALERQDGRDYHAKAEILTPAGQLLTSATARWRRIPGHLPVAE